jgi:hypothetical protein
VLRGAGGKRVLIQKLHSKVLILLYMYVDHYYLDYHIHCYCYYHSRHFTSSFTIQLILSALLS